MDGSISDEMGGDYERRSIYDSHEKKNAAAASMVVMPA